MSTKKSLLVVLALLFTLTSINPIHAGKVNSIVSQFLSYCCLCCVKDNHYDTFNEENEIWNDSPYKKLTVGTKKGKGTFVSKPNNPKYLKSISTLKTKADDTKDGQTEGNTEKEGFINPFALNSEPNNDKFEHPLPENNQST